MQQYKTKLESELYQRKLEDQQKQNEQWLQQQHAQFLEHEKIRRQNDEEMEERRGKLPEYQMQLQRQNEIARAHAEGEAKTKQERENIDIRIREMKAKAQEDYRTRIDSITTTLNSVGGAVNTLLSEPNKLLWTVGGLTALALGVYTAKNATRVAANLAEKTLGRPALVRETSRMKLDWKSTVDNFLGRHKPFKGLDNIVLNKHLYERLNWTSTALINTKKSGTPFQHLLLYGPPGTGKTLFARTLARQSGLDYAIMTGGDVGPLGKSAVEEINKVFAWAATSKRGLILFIDEADAFLRHGRAGDKMEEDTRQVLSAFLHHTGTEQSNFSVILATNQKDVMDRAVLDRMDEWFQLPLPERSERRLILDLFFDQHIMKETKSGRLINVEADVLSDEFLDSLADRTVGFSGRQLSKFVFGLQAAVFGSGPDTVLTRGLVETVLNYKLAHFDEEASEEQKAQAAEMGRVAAA